MSGHTPLPWKSDKAFCNETGKETRAIYHYPNEAWCVEVVESQNGEECIFGNYTGSEGEADANLEFIVRACNSHYELLEACKKAVVGINTANEIGLSNSNGLNKTRELIEATIAKSKGEV